MSKIVCFGELMLRLAPEGYERFVQAKKLNVEFGGAEANVAVSLANYGANCAFVTKLPQNQLGQAALNSLRRYGVDVSHVARGGERLGIYFLEKGAAQRSSLCIYDRAHSSFAESSPNDYDWGKIFAGAKWFHITGVTPALSKNCESLALESCKEAKRLGLKISCDLNYRSKLWSMQKAKKVMTEISKYVDLCITNEDDLKNVFGITTNHTDTDSGIIDVEAYKKTILLAAKKYGFSQIALTLRKSISASKNNWSAIFFDGEKIFQSRAYDIDIVERVGSGDAFAAGLIFALNENFSAHDALEFATAAGCLKHSVEGDFNMVSAEEVERLVHSSGSGRVIR